MIYKRTIQGFEIGKKKGKGDENRTRFFAPLPLSGNLVQLSSTVNVSIVVKQDQHNLNLKTQNIPARCTPRKSSKSMRSPQR